MLENECAWQVPIGTKDRETFGTGLDALPELNVKVIRAVVRKSGARMAHSSDPYSCFWPERN